AALYLNNSPNNQIILNTFYNNFLAVFPQTAIDINSNTVIMNNFISNGIAATLFDNCTNNYWNSTIASEIKTISANTLDYSNFTPYRIGGPFDITLGADVTPLPIITGITASITNYNVNLKWSKSTPVDFSAYNIYISDIPGTTNLSKSDIIIKIPNVNTTNYSHFPGLGTWYYHVTVSDIPDPNNFTNECWYSSETSVTVTNLPPPLIQAPSLLVIAVSTNQIDIIWNSISNATSYTLYRNTIPETNTATNITGFISTITNYSNTGLFPGTIYYYWMKAYNISGSSEYSVVASAKTLSGDIIPPAIPVIISIDADRNITITWNANTEPDFLQYNIYRSTTSGSGYVKVTSITNIDTTSYVDSG
ncbi:unnamed protein product, partial [marine sediment metagenome]